MNERLGDGDLFVHDETDLENYDRFFEFFVANGEMAGRIDALHSQHLRTGAKRDVLCVRLVDLWGERTYPIHRGRPAGRFVSKLTGPQGAEVKVADIASYRQSVDTRSGILTTNYDWRCAGVNGRNESTGFISKERKHLMAHRFVDTVQSHGWTRSFTVETIFPYHSRASAFYFKRPYGRKEWAWGEVEHKYEIEPTPNASIEYDEGSHTAIVSFATEFEPLATRVAWAIRPATPPDRWHTDEGSGAITFEWDLAPGVEHDAALFMSIVTDRDASDCRKFARDEAAGAAERGWDGVISAHQEWWESELAKSTVAVPDPRLQRLYDIAMLYMLQNVGGTYLPFIGVDNVIYETCMCDNAEMLHSLVETNHLDAARAELELLHTYLPAARKNAHDRMKVVLGIENDEAALLPFYMTEDGIALWQDNVFGMYSSTSADHFALLSKTASYANDGDFLLDVAYPWFRAYAEYFRLHAVWDEKRSACTFPIEHLGGGGEGYWYRQTMSNRLYWRIFSRSDPMFRFADFPPIEWFPLDEIRQLEGNWLDVVVNARWILTGAAEAAGRLDVDEKLRGEWIQVAECVVIPQNDEHYLQHLGETAGPYLGGPGVGSVFWPAEGFFEELDREKMTRTLSVLTSARHIEGYLRRGGRASDALNGFAYAYTGDGNEALNYLESFSYVADARGIEMRENVAGKNYYYLRNHGNLILLTRYMLLQTFKGTIRVFPAVPTEWRRRGVSFASLPAEPGLLVSARTDLNRSEVTIVNRAGDLLFILSGAFRTVEIVPGVEWDPPDTIDCALLGASGQITVNLPRPRAGASLSLSVNGEPVNLQTAADVTVTVATPATVKAVWNGPDGSPAQTTSAGSDGVSRSHRTA